jgi:hypothetical protein
MVNNFEEGQGSQRAVVRAMIMMHVHYKTAEVDTFL